ncbi:hypothetical protein Goklo_026763 [Gossypium klotzschianum]|uniref:Short-chain dehydrogenase/reductase SDR n=1 Tax=Gossypium klotzschianum TaxID=34286 RepID=A0A7J8TW57_9ROSI|nr:hypothetical protein [Gossypium klotzschianum]
MLADSIGARYIHCDVAKESDVESAIQLAITWKGKLDILFSNAGIGGTASSITSLDMEQVKHLVSINLLGNVHAIKHAARAMLRCNTKGSIICTSSSAGIMGGLASHPYSLSKAEEVKKLVGDQGSLLRGKAATVEDVAQAAVFLASDDTGFITAHNLIIDGGYTSAISSLSFIYK